MIGKARTLWSVTGSAVTSPVQHNFNPINRNMNALYLQRFAFRLMAVLFYSLSVRYSFVLWKGRSFGKSDSIALQSIPPRRVDQSLEGSGYFDADTHTALSDSQDHFRSGSARSKAGFPNQLFTAHQVTLGSKCPIKITLGKQAFSCYHYLLRKWHRGGPSNSLIHLPQTTENSQTATSLWVKITGSLFPFHSRHNDLTPTTERKIPVAEEWSIREIGRVLSQTVISMRDNSHAVPPVFSHLGH